MDKWIIGELIDTVTCVERHFHADDCRLHLATKRLKEFFLLQFCGFYLEATKPVLTNPNSTVADKQLVLSMLHACAEHVLLMYHPIMPSITEELWQKLDARVSVSNEEGFSGPFDSILDRAYPSSTSIGRFTASATNMEQVRSTVERVRETIAAILVIRALVQSSEWPKGSQRCAIFAVCSS